MPVSELISQGPDRKTECIPGGSNRKTLIKGFTEVQAGFREQVWNVEVPADLHQRGTIPSLGLKGKGRKETLVPEPARAGAVEEGPPGTGAKARSPPASEGAQEGALLRGQPPGAETRTRKRVKWRTASHPKLTDDHIFFQTFPIASYMLPHFILKISLKQVEPGPLQSPGDSWVQCTHTPKGVCRLTH